MLAYKTQERAKSQDFYLPYWVGMESSDGEKKRHYRIKTWITATGRGWRGAKGETEGSEEQDSIHVETVRPQVLQGSPPSMAIGLFDPSFAPLGLRVVMISLYCWFLGASPPLTVPLTLSTSL